MRTCFLVHRGLSSHCVLRRWKGQGSSLRHKFHSQGLLITSQRPQPLIPSSGGLGFRRDTNISYRTHASVLSDLGQWEGKHADPSHSRHQKTTLLRAGLNFPSQIHQKWLNNLSGSHWTNSQPWNLKITWIKLKCPVQTFWAIFSNFIHIHNTFLMETNNQYKT